MGAALSFLDHYLKQGGEFLTHIIAGDETHSTTPVYFPIYKARHSWRALAMYTVAKACTVFSIALRFSITVMGLNLFNYYCVIS